MTRIILLNCHLTNQHILLLYKILYYSLSNIKTSSIKGSMKDKNLFDYFETSKKQKIEENCEMNLSTDKESFIDSEEVLQSNITKRDDLNKVNLRNSKIKKSEIPVNNQLEKKLKTNDLFESESSMFSESDVNTTLNIEKDNRYGFLVNIRDKNGNEPSSKNYDKSSLYISNEDLKKLTPFERQFWEIKKDYWDTIVFFKKGKFYELYENDADVAGRLFNFKITDRVNMRMAGFPEGKLDEWLGRFLDAGYKVARVDQKENMVGKMIRESNLDTQKGKHKKDIIITRELKEIITQGTIYDNDHLSGNKSVYIISIIEENNEFFILLYDASISKIFYKYFKDDEFYNNLRNISLRYNIKEYICRSEFNFLGNHIIPDLLEKDKLNILEVLNMSIEKILTSDKDAIKKMFSEALSNLWNYMKYLRREENLKSCKLEILDNITTNMILDNSTIQNMDLISEEHDKTLFNLINKCNTPFGTRNLKKWMLSPLSNYNLLCDRQRLIDHFVNQTVFNEDLKNLGDFERFFAKINYGNLKLKDIHTFMEKVSIIVRIYRNIEYNVFEKIYKGKDSNVEDIVEISRFEEILQHNSRRLKSKHLKELLEFQKDFNMNFIVSKEEIIPGKLCKGDINKLISEKDNLISKLNDYLEEQKDILKMNSVSNKHNTSSITYKNIGKEIFQMEIPKSVEVPEDYFLMSATKSHNRYYTNTLKKLVNEYNILEEKIFQMQGSIILTVAEYIMEYKNLFSEIIRDLSLIDCLISCARFNTQNSVVRPVLSDKIEIINLRNPIYKDYVSNDYNEENKILILTGPNMAGKSTFMRSITLNLILYQMGLNVFSDSFKSPVFDKIFSRIGASDNLLRGESTFMVELIEINYILKNSTDRSFIIIDELGRGTSTKDGKCIGRGVLNELERINCRVMFSTHYHDLLSETEKMNVLSYGYMNTLIQDNNVIFLYKLVKGVCKDSNGIHVGRLAKVPEKILERAYMYKKYYLNKN